MGDLSAQTNWNKARQAAAQRALTGMLEPGNIDYNTRPVVKMPDGSIATVRSITVTGDDGAYLIPTVSDDGRIMSNEEAVDQFRKTGRHLGRFRDEDSADAYAEKHHAEMAPPNVANEMKAEEAE